MYYTNNGSKALTLLEDCFHPSIYISEQGLQYQLERTETYANVSSGSSVVQVLEA